MGERYEREQEGMMTTRDDCGENGRHGTTNNNKGMNDTNTNDKEQDGTCHCL